MKRSCGGNAPKKLTTVQFAVVSNGHSAAKLDKVGTQNVGAEGMMHGLGMHFGDGCEASYQLLDPLARYPASCYVFIYEWDGLGGFDVQNFLDSDSRHGHPWKALSFMKHAARAMRMHELRDVDNVRDAETRAIQQGVSDVCDNIVPLLTAI
jgi:hypothetical protein